MPLHPKRSDSLRNIQVAKFEVEYDNVFNLKAAYQRVYEWLVDWGFKGVDDPDGSPVAIPENFYMELVAGNGAKNHHIWWRVHRKDSQYHKYYLKIDFQTLVVSSIEVMHKGKKIKTNKGDIILRVEGWLMLDYNEEWKKHWILKHFEHNFINSRYREKIESYKKDLWFTVYNLQDTFKDHLEINTSYDMPKPFSPRKGLPND